MDIQVKQGDVLDEQADVLISTANPWLNMSGGVNGAILLRGGQRVQEELRKYLKQEGRPHVEPGTVVPTGPGPLSVRYILHAVAIDAFYDSSPELVGRTAAAALDRATQLGASTVAMPALATGYGHLTMEQFARGLARALNRDWSLLARLTVVLRQADDAHIVSRILREAADLNRDAG
jgi:O-acetyl-ADP-ribose deacetylase (regulator of RNase III)